MCEISISDNNFYKTRFDEAIELKHSKENMINKYNEEINLFTREFAEMIMNPPIDKDTNTCMTIEFRFGDVPLENFSDEEISSKEETTMIIQFKKLMLSSCCSFENCPFYKLFMKYVKSIKDIVYNRTRSEIIHDMLHQLNQLDGFKKSKWDILNDDSIRLKLQIKNPKYSAPAAN